MSPAIAIGAVVLLVAVGTAEAQESARQLAELATFTGLRLAGAGLTALGLVASAAVYTGLGWWTGQTKPPCGWGRASGPRPGSSGEAFARGTSPIRCATPSAVTRPFRSDSCWRC